MKAKTLIIHYSQKWIGYIRKIPKLTLSSLDTSTKFVFSPGFVADKAYRWYHRPEEKEGTRTLQKLLHRRLLGMSWRNILRVTCCFKSPVGNQSFQTLSSQLFWYVSSMVDVGHGYSTSQFYRSLLGHRSLHTQITLPLASFQSWLYIKSNFLFCIWVMLVGSSIWQKLDLGKNPGSKFTILITLRISRHYEELSEVEANGTPRDEKMSIVCRGASAGNGNRISSIHKQTFQHGIEDVDMGLSFLQGFTEKEAAVGRIQLK